MSGKQAATPQMFDQMLNAGPSNAQPIESRCAAAYFVQNDKAMLRRLIQDRRRFNHFHHKRRSTTGKVIRSTHATEQTVDAG